jgi:transketolase
VLAPCDEVEVRLGLRAAIANDGPVYMRIGKKGEPVIHKTAPQFRIGRSITVRPGSDVCVLSAGTIMAAALGAAHLLEARGISARVESFHTIKPLDTDLLEQVFDQYAVVAVVEEHSRLGGLGGSVAEWLAARRRVRARLVAFGTDDTFLHEIGSQNYARRRFGLTAENIAAQVTSTLHPATA